MLTEHEICIEVLTNRLHEEIAKAKTGYLPVDDDPQNWIDFALMHTTSSYNDGYLQGLKTALNIVEGVFQIETTEAQAS